ncbi:hypothetical protein GW17_00034637 [Ensete ventricosum]|nr:hypothetical protein GW17_00034637 [Ensete ventricosum]
MLSSLHGGRQRVVLQEQLQTGTYLPKWTKTPGRKGESIVVMIIVSGADRAKKTGPRLCIVHDCRKNASPVTTMPCQASCVSRFVLA